MWKGWRDSKGLSRILVKGQHYLAHRWAFEMENGPIPDGKMIKPSCGTRGCCNPSHQRVVTWGEVNQDTADNHSEIVRSQAEARLVPRLWSKIAVNSDPGRCWEWTGSRYRAGYGSFGLRGKTNHAHRYVWESMYGPIPEGQFVCHHCDNPPCCNPYHLFLGPPKSNTADMIRKGRQGYTGRAKKLTWERAQMIRRLFESGEIWGPGLAGAF